MKIVDICKGIAFGVIAFGLMSTVKAADTSVTVSDVHLCCGSCVAGANTAVNGVTGAHAEVDAPGKTVKITAPDKETAQKAIDALTAAGYFGKSSDNSLKVSTPASIPEGKVTEIKVENTHLCCGKCVAAVKGILSKLDGVTSSTVVPKATEFSAVGNFDAKQLFEELNKAGLTGKVAAK